MLAFIFVIFKGAPSGMGKGIALNLTIAILALATVGLEWASRAKPMDPDADPA